jgi:hypothetical protein
MTALSVVLSLLALAAQAQFLALAPGLRARGGPVVPRKEGASTGEPTATAWEARFTRMLSARAYTREPNVGRISGPPCKANLHRGGRCELPPESRMPLRPA